MGRTFTLAAALLFAVSVRWLRGPPAPRSSAGGAPGCPSASPRCRCPPGPSSSTRPRRAQDPRLDRRLLLRTPAGHVRTLLDGPDFIWESGETGLMSLAVDPRFGRNRRIYACYGASTAGGGHDVRVAAWRLNHARTHVRRIETLVTGMPSTSGRHGGCRLKISPAGALFIGTGDAATGTNPQDLTSLGGKVLRVNRFTGKGMPGNPFAQATNANTRRIYTYGHRNVQGLAWRPGDTMWSVEHGPDRTTRLTGSCPAATMGGTRCPATTSRCR